jgi:hypothetical protein
MLGTKDNYLTSSKIQYKLIILIAKALLRDLSPGSTFQLRAQEQTPSNVNMSIGQLRELPEPGMGPNTTIPSTVNASESPGAFGSNATMEGAGSTVGVNESVIPP